MTIHMLTVKKEKFYAKNDLIDENEGRSESNNAKRMKTASSFDC